jgi:5-methylcytosine-specific restriction protein B
MNLIDQGVEQLDFALRRRFLWLYSGFDADIIGKVVKSKWEDYGLSHHPWERLQPDVEQLAERATALNSEVSESKLLGQQYEIGHTYFFDSAGFIRRWGKVRTKGLRPKRYLWKEDGTPLAPVLDLWRHSLRPLMQEYLAGIEPQARDREVERLGKLFLHGPDS